MHQWLCIYTNECACFLAVLYVGIYRIALELSRKAEEKHKKTASIVAQRALSQLDSGGGGGSTTGGRSTSLRGVSAADAAAAVLQQQQQHYAQFQHTPVSARPSSNAGKDDDDRTSSCSPEPGISTLEAPTTSSGSRSPNMHTAHCGHQKQEPQQHTVLVEPKVQLHREPEVQFESAPTPASMQTGAQRPEPPDRAKDSPKCRPPDGEAHAALGAASSLPPAVTSSAPQPPRNEHVLQSPSRQLSVPATSGVHQRPANALESGECYKYSKSY